MESTSTCCPVTLFDHFVAASTFKTIQTIFNQICSLLHIDPLDDESANFYQNLKCGLAASWKAQKLWTLLDKRASQKEYCRQRVCTPRMHVLIVGAGPCGLRAAIECALLGARTIVVEKRERFSRNNVLHIWPFVIQDLKNLGAKIFYPKFCAGSIDHISIRQLQCILLKVSLILGVHVNEGVSFCSLVEPRILDDGQVTGWRATFSPADHFLSEYEFVALIGADGKRNTIPGFPRREMRGKLAIGITANFINRRSHAEEKVAEISGVAFIFNQQFFKDMKLKTGIDLENIVYYKDETHYFVMTAKKQSLIDKRVLISDYDDISSLLAVENIDQQALMNYAREAADFSTEGLLPHLDFALNHFAEPDVAMFDFTSLFSAQCSIRLVERVNRSLLMSIVGDSLHEPFWPTGSGCARGFLGVFDTVWLLREFALAKRGTMQIIAERESIFRLLTQATPENLHRNLQKYSIDPRTRYTSLDLNIRADQVSHLIDTDNPRLVPMDQPIPLTPSSPSNVDKFIRHYRLLRACQRALTSFKLPIFNLTSSWSDGRALLALVARYRPQLIDYTKLNTMTMSTMLDEVFTVVRNEFGIEQPCNDWLTRNNDQIIDYLQQLIDRFAKEQPTPIKTQKRKSPRHFDASSVKKSEPIQKRGDQLFESLKYKKDENGQIDDELRFIFDAKDNDQLNDVDIEHILNEWDDEDMQRANNNKHERRLGNVEGFAFSGWNNNTDNAKKWTKRPIVEKLHPERIYQAERIVSGAIETEKSQQLYQHKRHQAQILTRKMQPKDIEEMETKLEQTAMGVLFNRDQFKAMSSKEEKIVRVKAAEARKAAEEGFSRQSDKEKYKDIDEKLNKANALMKNQNLAGIDIVSRTVQQQQQQLILASPLRSKPPVPLPSNRQNRIESNNVDTTSNGSENSINTKSSPPRPQKSCQLCRRIVYLAEQMQVESMFIHKKCFRCAYCHQALRLGNCGFDRDLISTAGGGRFFCMKHLNLPLAEKIARIEKLDTQTIRSDASDDEAIRKPPTPPTLEHSAIISRPTKLGLTQLNSPSTILAKTMQKMRVQAEASVASNNILPPFVANTQQRSPTTPSSRTPERAEFECYRQSINDNRRRSIDTDDVDERQLQRHNLGYDDDDVYLWKDDGIYRWKNSPKSSPKREITTLLVEVGADRSEKEIDSSMEDEEEDDDEDEDEDLSDREIAELETTVFANVDSTLSDRQAVELLNTWKHRRESNFIIPPDDGSCRENDIDTMTKKNDVVVFRRTSAGAELKLPQSSEEDGSQKLKEIAQYREDMRLRARMKSDQELGINSSIDRASIPIINGTDLIQQRTVSRLSMPTVPFDTAEKSKLPTVPIVDEVKLKSTTKGGLLSTLYGVNKKKHSLDSEDEKSKSIAPNGQIRKEPSKISVEKNDSMLKKHPKQPIDIDGDEVIGDGHIDIVSAREIRKVQKTAEKIVLRREQNRQRQAQDIQRRLQEIEVRKAEVQLTGGELEQRLVNDPENRWLLEQWLLFVKEREQLDRKESDFRLEAKDLELQNEHSRIQTLLRQRTMLSTNFDKEDIEVQTNLLQQLQDIIEQRDRIVHEQDVERCKEIDADRRMKELIAVKGHSYVLFGPVFMNDLSLTTTTLLAP